MGAAKGEKEEEKAQEGHQADEAAVAATTVKATGVPPQPSAARAKAEPEWKQAMRERMRTQQQEQTAAPEGGGGGAAKGEASAAPAAPVGAAGAPGAGGAGGS